MTSLTQTLRLSLFLLTASSLAFSQGLAPATPSKDYIRFSGRVVAIESPAPVVDFSPASVSFVKVLIGATASQVVTVTNGGTKTLAISAVALAGPNSSSFSLVNNCGASLTPRASCTVTVSFNTATPGTYSANLVMTDSSGGSPHSVSLSGNAVPPAPVAGVTPPSLTFSGLTTGQTSAGQAATVTNSGTAALLVSSVAISGANPSDFATSNNCGGSVAVSGSCAVTVSFTPTAVGARAASVTITDNNGAVAGSTQTVTLTGAGLGPIAAVLPGTLNFGPQNLGTTSAGQTATVSNSGNAPLTLSVPASAGAFSVANGCGGSVAANASCPLTVTFTPSSGGAQTATLTITDNSQNVANATQTVTLNGTGVPVPAIAFSPTSLTWSDTFPGSQSPYAHLTVTNSGTGPLTISSVGLSSGDFVIGQNTCGTVAPQGTCTVTVAFAPPSKGTFSGNLVFTDNAGNVANAKQTVALQGTSKCAVDGCS